LFSFLFTSKKDKGRTTYRTYIYKPKGQRKLLQVQAVQANEKIG